jgi:hypothetical protein
MDPNIIHCFYSVNSGLSALNRFDQVLAAGDLDGATDQLIELWNKMYEPTQVLTELYEGEFWNDWLGKRAFEDNLRTVYSLLNEFEKNTSTFQSLEEVRDYLHANFLLLQDFIKILTADIGEDRLRKISLAQQQN